MEAFLISAVVVLFSEMGDKTQLLAIVLSARFKKPVPIILGIFTSTLANHAAAGLFGEWLTTHISGDTLRWVVGGSFAAIALWALKPDTFEEKPSKIDNYGAFFVTLVAFFLAEIGDKTQIATVALAMKYHHITYVVMGTTLGMMLADVPAVLLADAVTKRIPMKVFRLIAAAIFALLAILAFCGVGVSHLPQS